MMNTKQEVKNSEGVVLLGTMLLAACAPVDEGRPGGNATAAHLLASATKDALGIDMSDSLIARSL